MMVDKNYKESFGDRMKLDRGEFRTHLNTGIGLHLGRLSEKERNYVRDKGEKLFDLIEELHGNNFLKFLTKEKITEIRSEYDKIMKNVDEIRNIYLLLMKLLENNKGSAGATHITLRDVHGNSYSISMKQIVILIGISYSYLCEVIRTWLSEIINFTKEPTGLGGLVWILKNDMKIRNLHFFDDLDNLVRNAFFHMDFELRGDKIFCKNKSKNPYINLGDLFWLHIFADRSSYATMHICEYVFKKS